MKKFEVGKKYYGRSACDYDCIFSIEVVARTEKTIKVIIKGSVDTKPCRLKAYQTDDISEFVLPYGRYSMCPVICADDEIKGET